ncbi:MAG: xylose repressor [Acidobacteriota bacterium]
MGTEAGGFVSSINRAAMVRSNCSSILHFVRQEGKTSRASLAELTGLNKATISRLVEKLTSLGLLREVGEEASSGRGRKAVLLEINPGGGFIVSGEIGVDYLLVACADLSSRILWRKHESTARLETPRAVLERCAVLMEEAIRFGSTTSDRLLGLAVGVPGLVDGDGTLLFAPNLGWRDVRLGAFLRRRFQKRVFVDNEANLAALGEYYYGAARGHEQVLYISAGVGVGGGLIYHGQLLTGNAGFAGEFGHMTMDPQGPRCKCGNRGCWETLASQAALFRNVREAVADGAKSYLVERCGPHLEGLTVEAVIEAAEAGDEVAAGALREVGIALGVGMASLINATNPDLVVFGGPLSAAGDLIFPLIQDEVRRRVLPRLVDTVRVVCARNGADNCVLGGVARVCEWVVQHPLEAVAEAAAGAGSGEIPREADGSAPLRVVKK